MNVRLIALAVALLPALAYAQPGPAIESDPLAWLEREMSCQELTDQIKSRYAPLGKFSEMPDEKKRELRNVLGVVCSPKFARCGFKSCGPTVAGNSDGPSVLEEADLEERAEARLRSLVADLERDRNKAIAAAKKLEAERKLGWERVVMAEEIRKGERAVVDPGDEPRRERSSAPARNTGRSSTTRSEKRRSGGKSSSPPTSFSY